MLRVLQSMIQAGLIQCHASSQGQRKLDVLTLTHLLKPSSPLTWLTSLTNLTNGIQPLTHLLGLCCCSFSSVQGRM